MSDREVLHNIVNIFIKNKISKRSPLAWNVLKKSFILLDEDEPNMSEEILQVASEEMSNENFE